MKSRAMRQGSLFLLLAIITISETTFNKDISENALPRLPRNDVPGFITYEINEKYIRHMSSIIKAYRSDMIGGRLIIETNSQVDMRYKTWKRNADLINSILALPKGLSDAGR